jgi:hypothetical protein
MITDSAGVHTNHYGINNFLDVLEEKQEVAGNTKG